MNLDFARRSASRLIATAQRAQPTPALEKWAVDVFRRLDRSAPPPGENVDAVHVLNPQEQAALRRIERSATQRAAVAGMLSATASSFAEIYGSRPVFWAVLGGASAVEIAFLYWDALRSVHSLSRAAGLPIFAASAPDAAVDPVAMALARAALELPNPPDNLFGINPLKKASRWTLLVASILYKAKIAVTNVLLRALLGRLAGRVLARSYFALISIPVTAAWNALIVRMVLREARIRIMGPSAAEERLSRVFAGEAAGAEGLALRAVACSVVSNHDLHPNLLALMTMLAARAGAAQAVSDLDSEERFLSELAAAAPAHQAAARAVLELALVLDGKLTVRERKLWAQASNDASPAELGNLRKAFVQGRL